MIVGGTAVPDGKYPFMAYLDYTKASASLPALRRHLDRQGQRVDRRPLPGNLSTTSAKVIVGRTDLRKKNQGQVVCAISALHPSSLQWEWIRCRGPKAQACGKGHQADQARHRKTKQSRETRTHPDDCRLGGSETTPRHFETARIACAKCRSPWFLTLAPNGPISLRAKVLAEPPRRCRQERERRLLRRQWRTFVRLWQPHSGRDR